MLIRPTIDQLDAKYDSRYEITMLAAQRARQIKDGAPALTKPKEQNPVTQAAIEIEKDLIKPKY